MVSLGLFLSLQFSFVLLAWHLSKEMKAGRSVKRPKRRRPISILKPIKGYDYNLVSNVLSFFSLDFIPGDEIIFCFEDANDEALPALKCLLGEDKHIPARIMIGKTDVGVNPKIQNIYKSFFEAKNELVLISDANVRAPFGYLNALDQEFEDDTGILTAPIVCVDCLTFPAKIEAMIQQKFYNKWLLISNHLGQSIVMGKSMMFNRRKFLLAGGLNEASEYLAEDYTMGQMMTKNIKLKTKVLSLPVYQVVGKRTFREVVDRFVRWGRMRKAHAPRIFLMEILSSLSFASLALTLASPWWVGMLFISAWCYFEFGMVKNIVAEESFIAPYIVSEWFTIPIWVWGLCGSHVEWRGRKFYLSAGGKCVGGLNE